MIIKLDLRGLGTGTHPTTKMSLFVGAGLAGGETVLDGGTKQRSSLIASSLGAAISTPHDLDEVAVRGTENMVNPGMENIHVAPGDLSSECRNRGRCHCCQH